MAKVIMVQGTMSNVGKSLITAGLLRVFMQDGYKVAPFKSQNMALNSYITKDGLEIGRAQAMQAEACKIEPSVYMNPILLKPTSDIGSQVIVNGVPVGTMPAKEYFSYDIVNMGLAEFLDAPVLLVGDIDRGGVFAQLAGTLLLLEEKERERVKGLIINKFRGDKSILEPGLGMLEKIVKKSVIGVVPYGDMDIHDEDSLAERLSSKGKKGMLNIRIVRLPRISNFTDFYILEATEGLQVQYVMQVSDLMDADLIIIPGSKSTIEDLLWLRSSGIEAAIKKEVEDLVGAESTKTVRGMELLPIRTEFQKEKTTKQVKGEICNNNGFFKELGGATVQGYEIHMGVSRREGQALAKLSARADTKEIFDGCIQGTCMGTYLHGIFDNKEFTDRLFRLLLKAKGYSGEELETPDMAEYKERQYNKLAQLIRDNVDIKMVYGCMGMRHNI